MQGDITTGLSLILPYAAGFLVLAVSVAALAYLGRRPLGRFLASVSPTGETVDGSARVALLFALTVIVLFVAVELFATLAFALGGGVGTVVVVTSLLATGVFLFAAARTLVPTAQMVRTSLVIVVLLAVVLAGAIAFSAQFYDVAWDSNWYHQQATLSLAHGWNPLHDPAGETVRIGQWRPDLQPGLIWEFAVEHYPKGEWIRAAAVVTMLGNLEYPKALNYLLIVAQGLVWFAALALMAPRRWKTAVLAGVLMAVNPICIIQALTLKNDGQVGSFLTIAAALGWLVWARKGSWPAVLGLCGSLVLLSNMKFTGLVYAVVLAGSLFVALLWRSRERASVVTALSLVAAGLIAVFVVGYNPYVQNTLDHGHPFHPLMGAEKFDNITNQWPRNFDGTIGPERLFLSLFSRSSDEVYLLPGGAETHLKLPFVIYRDELRPFMGFDTRVGGFGPLFGGALVLGALLLVVLLVRRAWRDRVVGEGLVVSAVLMATALINPESWWARYAPQIWMLPVLLLVLVLVSEAPRWERAVAYALAAVLVINVSLVGAINFTNTVNGTREINAALDEIEKWPQPVILSMGDFAVNWVKFEERGIEYRLLEKGDWAQGPGLVIPYTTIRAYPAQ